MTAFEPYDHWSDNSSWLALVEFTKSLTSETSITTRRYPVDFASVRERLESDLADAYDYALHLGQAPGAAEIRLEAIGLNVGGNSDEPTELHRPLVDDGPVAYRSGLPLAQWVRELRGRGIPAAVSYHAGTYLCNATLYLTHYLAERRGHKTQATFIHLPLDASQAAAQAKEISSLPTSTAAAAVRMIVQLVKQSQPHAPKLA